MWNNVHACFFCFLIFFFLWCLLSAAQLVRNLVNAQQVAGSAQQQSDQSIRTRQSSECVGILPLNEFDRKRIQFSFSVAIIKYSIESNLSEKEFILVHSSKSSLSRQQELEAAVISHPKKGNRKAWMHTHLSLYILYSPESWPRKGYQFSRHAHKETYLPQILDSAKLTLVLRFYCCQKTPWSWHHIGSLL